MTDDIRRTTNLLGAGTLAYHFVPKILAACEKMGAAVCLNTVGFAEFNRNVNYRPSALARPGVIDVSPAAKEIRIAIGNAGDDFIAEQNRHAWERLAYQTVDKMVRATHERRLNGSQMLWTQGARTGHGKPAEEMLRRAQENVPDMFTVVKSTLPADADQRPKAVIGYKLFHELQDSRIITSTLLTDNMAPFALRYQLAVQDEYEAKALASLLAAQPQFGMNRALGEIGKSLGEQGYFAGWAFCSRSLEPVKESLAWSFVRSINPNKLPHRGQGNVAHAIQQAWLATQTALTEPTARAIDEDINLSKPLFISYIVPIARSEGDQWSAFSNEIKRRLSVSYPNAVPIFTSGQGTPDPRYHGSYWLQVSVLFPLPTVPRPIREYVSPPMVPPKIVHPELGGGASDIPAVLAPNGVAHAPTDYIPGKEDVA